MITFCGYIALTGRPNVGKSTLLNQLLRQKISITSRKPQTTRHRILGVQTEGQDQFVYVDTPGIHLQSKKTLNRMMNRTALNVLCDVDVIAFIVDGTHWNDDDDYVLQCIEKANKPCLLVVNKIDKIKDKTQLLPWFDSLRQRYDFQGIMPLSAKTGDHVPELQQQFKAFLQTAA